MDTSKKKVKKGGGGKVSHVTASSHHVTPCECHVTVT